jgi:hypothetical protein
MGTVDGVTKSKLVKANSPQTMSRQNLKRKSANRSAFFPESDR